MASSSCRLWEYDVFLSFRGEDTRKTFLSHLHKALVNKGIITFKDDRKLDMGDSIFVELVNAIKASKFAIVVISFNYATSGWCLDELRLIMELHGEKKLTALPIFYGVEPSDVRHQRGSFATAFERYNAPEMAEKVQTWREALTQVADLSGKDPGGSYEVAEMAEKVPKWREALTEVSNLSGKDSGVFADEAAMIEEIVRGIFIRLVHMTPRLAPEIVGLEAHMEKLDPLLNIESGNEVLMIGIWGMGGIGKTTIAEGLYQRYSHRFPTHCFLRNIKTVAEHGLSYLRAKFLSDILCEDLTRLLSTEVGYHEIKARLGHQKVLIVLDDVDNMNQLQTLAADPRRWFGQGSRIIITTRDKGLLNSFRVNTIHKVDCLENEDALQMFKEVAFEGGCLPSEDYEQLSIRASRLARGLPSALEAFAIHLRGKTTTEDWESELDQFEIAPHRNIIKILETSITGLDEPDKAIFLHVASLFNGNSIQRVAALLGYTESRIKGLAEKSLIDISTDGCITMHILVEQTGRVIVRQESSNGPSNQKTLWDPREIYDVLEDETGTEHVEGVALHICEMPHKLSMSRSVFRPMKNLRFLKFYKHLHNPKSMLEFITNLDSLPRKLSLLHWDAYPSTTLPSGFRPLCLVELNMHYSNLENLWDGTPELANLRSLDVTGSENLRQLPDLSGAIKLEELITRGCTRLRQIPESIGGLSSMKKLDLSNCDGLTDLVINIEELAALRDRQGRHCKRITLKFPNATQKLNSLTHVSIDAKINIQFLPSLEGNAEHLFFSSEQQAAVDSMMREQQARDLTQEFHGLNSLDIMRFNYSEVCVPFRCHSFSIFPCLRKLHLINLNIEEIPDNIDLPFLEILDLSGNDFKYLPHSMRYLTELKYLGLRNCRKLEVLPELTKLETLALSDCINLHTLVQSPDVEDDHRSFCLLELQLDNCRTVRSLSDQLHPLTNLKELDLSRHDFETIPSRITTLSSLETLSLNYCRNLKSVEGLPLNLKRLYAHGCEALETVSLSSNHSVEDFDIDHCFRLKQDNLVTRFPTDRRSKEVSPRCVCSRRTVPSGQFHDRATIFQTTHLQQSFLAFIFVAFAAIILFWILQRNDQTRFDSPAREDL